MSQDVTHVLCGHIRRGILDAVAGCPQCLKGENKLLREALRDIALGRQPCDYGKYNVACQRMANTAINALEGEDQ